MQNKATTVRQYLDALPADRRAAIDAVRKVVLASVDRDIEEGMQYGMIGYYVPHRVFPDGYHCDPKQPVPYAALASQKQHMSLYLMCAYGDQGVERFICDRYQALGMKLDMGKSCIRFKSLDEIDLATIAAALKMTPSAEHLRNYVLQVGPGAWKKKAKEAAKRPAPESAATRKAAKRSSGPKRAAKRTSGAGKAAPKSAKKSARR
jgi:hypothetical protein